MSAAPKLGLGIGWRPELALLIERRPDLGFVEVIAESVSDRGPLLPALVSLRRRGVAVVPHGIGLSLGGAEPVDPRRVDRLARLAERLEAPLVSEHIAFVRAGGAEAGHLLPLPRTRAALEVLIDNVRAAQAALPVPLALENVAALFEWPEQELGEGEFVTAALAESGARLLLDVANLHANARNHGGDPAALLDELPLDRLAYVHVAGGVERDGLYHDTHGHPVGAPVLALLEELCARAEVPGVLLERDDRFPPAGETAAELAAIAAAVERGDRRRGERGGRT